MGNWSSKKIPYKYRYLQKQIDDVWEFIKNLPTPSVDFFSLSPRERDLFEYYYGCILLTVKKQKETLAATSHENKEIKIDEKLFKKIAMQFFTKLEFKEASEIFKNSSQKIIEKNDRFWLREHKNNLFLFLKKQQKIYQWLPSGRLHFANLTWVGWEELLCLVEKYGYNRSIDEFTKNIAIKNWQKNEQRNLVNLFLEMINDEKTTEVFNSLENHKYIVRKRFFYFLRKG